MDLNKRLDQVDDELKLIKNEIKQVLLEIQERVLTVQSPFSNLAAGDGPASPVDDALVTGLNQRVDQVDDEVKLVRSELRNEIDQIGEEVKRLKNELKNTTTAGSRAPSESPAAAPQAQVPQAPSLAPQASAPAPQPVYVGPPGGMFPLPGQRGDAYELSETERRAPSTRRRRAKRELDPMDSDDPTEDIEEEAEESAPLAERPAMPAEQQSPQDPQDPKDSRSSAVHQDVDGPEPAVRGGPRRGPARSDSRSTGPAIVAKPKDSKGFDLFTIAALARWTVHVVGKIGKDNLGPLLEVSEMRGHLPKGVKEIVLILARLIADGDNETGLTPKEMVSLLAQLDALAGIGSPPDARILHLLFQGDLEAFPSIQP